MNPCQIRTFLLEHEAACLYDFSIHFNLPEEEIKELLENLVKAKKIKKEIVAHCCNSGCSECYTDVYEFYSWIG